MALGFVKKLNTALKDCLDGGSPGYSLIELIAVIVIIGILSNVAVVEFKDTNEKARLFNAAQIALADVRYAQEAAMNNGRTVRFVVQPGSNRYFAQYVDDNSFVQNSQGRDLDVSFAGNKDYTGVNINSSGTGANLTFSGIGRPDRDGSGAFFTNATIMILNNEFEIVVLGSGMTSFNRAGGGGCGC